MILASLSDGSPRRCRDVEEAMGLNRAQVYNALYQCCKL